MDTFNSYLRDIGRYPLLTKDQEIILARQVKAWIEGDDPSPQVVRRGQRAYQKLVNCNLRLVVSIAKRYTNKCKRTELSDLVQEGSMGLAHGVKKFDPERGYALSTYVYWWIRQSITRYLATHDRVIRLPSHAVELLTKLRNWTPMFQNTHGRKPTLEECADFCKISPNRLQEYIDRSNDAVSLDSRINSTDDDVMLIDSVSSDFNLFDEVSWGIDLEKVEGILCKLQPRERYVVECSFGLGTNPPMTFQAISKELGISRERTRNIFHGSVRKLRMYFRKIDTN